MPATQPVAPSDAGQPPDYLYQLPVKWEPEGDTNSTVVRNPLGNNCGHDMQRLILYPFDVKLFEMEPRTMSYCLR